MYILDITCGQLAPFMRILAYLINLIKFIIPIVLIVVIVIDLVKAFMANDDKKVNEAKNAAVKRVVYAVVIYLVPTLISLLFNTLGENFGGTELTSATEWIRCFNRFN